MPQQGKALSNATSLALLWAGGLDEMTVMGLFQSNLFCAFATSKTPVESSMASPGLPITCTYSSACPGR